MLFRSMGVVGSSRRCPFIRVFLVTSASPRSRLRLFVVAACLVSVGLGTKVYVGPGDAWVHAHGGGLIYVCFWILAALLLWPRAAYWKVSGAVFLVTAGIEFAQLWTPSWLQAIRATRPGALVLGTTFSPADFVYYALGAVAALPLVHLCRAARTEPGISD